MFVVKNTHFIVLKLTECFINPIKEIVKHLKYKFGMEQL
jgi:hypothetical protein